MLPVRHGEEVKMHTNDLEQCSEKIIIYSGLS